MTPEERAAKVMVGWHTIIEEDFRQTIQSEVAAAIREAVKAEREECAKVADSFKYIGMVRGSVAHARDKRCRDIAAAIRERKS